MNEQLRQAIRALLPELGKSYPPAASLFRIRNKYPIPSTGLRDQKIITEIDFLRELSRDYYAGDPEEQKSCNHGINAYSYARDILRAETLGDFGTD